MRWSSAMSLCHRASVMMAAVGVLAIGVGDDGAWAADMPNACPVDGCKVQIMSVKRSGSELQLTLKSNFTPDVSKNHIHVWWGEKYTSKQVGRNAVPVHGVKQGRWHRHDDYPVYVTTGAASTTARDNAKTICVTAADRGHNVLNATLFHCVDASSHL